MGRSIKDFREFLLLILTLFFFRFGFAPRILVHSRNKRHISNAFFRGKAGCAIGTWKFFLVCEIWVLGTTVGGGDFFCIIQSFLGVGIGG